MNYPEKRKGNNVNVSTTRQKPVYVLQEKQIVEGFNQLQSPAREIPNSPGSKMCDLDGARSEGLVRSISTTYRRNA